MRMRKSIQGGFSLIELMIAITLGGVILAGVLGTVLASKRSFTVQNETSNIQASYRFAMEFLSRDIRLAGYAGCASPYKTSFANMLTAAKLDNSSSFKQGSISVAETEDARLLYADRYGIRGISGYENGQLATEFPGFNTSSTTSDAIIIRFADPDRAMRVATQSLASQHFEVFDNAIITTGTNLVAVNSNCRDVSLFQATSVSAGGATSRDTIGYAPSSTSLTPNCSSVIKANEGSYLNCTESACGSTSCANPSPTSPSAFSRGSTLMPYEVAVFYIEASNVVPGANALKRTVLSGANSVTEELVLGADELQITYGIDTSPIPDGVLDTFVEATAVPDWNRIVSVRFEFLARSMERVLDIGQVQTLADGTPMPADGYLREKIAHTVRLRNR